MIFIVSESQQMTTKVKTVIFRETVAEPTPCLPPIQGKDGLQF